MPKIVGKSTTVVDVDGLTINEYVGNVGSKSDQFSMAVVKISSPTSEPWLTLDYDEWMVVCKGKVELHYDDGKSILAVNEGETVFIPKGERFRPVFPEAGTEYIPICIPAFKPERCLREESGGINASDVSQKLDTLHLESQSGGTGTSSYPDIVYHMCQKVLWDEVVKSGEAYFPPTFVEDGNFTHATSEPSRLMDTANHFYTATKGQFICLELSTKKLRSCGIVTLFEEPKPVGEKAVHVSWQSSSWECPHIYGGIPVNVPGIITNTIEITRDEDGNFLGIPGLTDKKNKPSIDGGRMHVRRRSEERGMGKLLSNRSIVVDDDDDDDDDDKCS